MVLQISSLKSYFFGLTFLIIFCPYFSYAEKEQGEDLVEQVKSKTKDSFVAETVGTEKANAAEDDLEPKLVPKPLPTKNSWATGDSETSEKDLARRKEAKEKLKKLHHSENPRRFGELSAQEKIAREHQLKKIAEGKEQAKPLTETDVKSHAAGVIDRLKNMPKEKLKP